MRDFFQNKSILITGGTGSIGSEILRQLLALNPKVIRILSRDEAKQFNLAHELKHHDNIRYLVGDIRDKERLYWAIEGIDIIFHAAALKQVPSCEYNPFEAVKTNVLGTQNVIEVALDERVKQLISISTDKAALPSNTMGATKLLAERLVIGANFYKGLPHTRLSCVRFGNVLGSRCSIIPIINSQVKAGGPVTITDTGATRFVMSIREAVSLVLRAAAKTVGGEIFVLKMPVVRIVDLIEVLVEELSPLYGKKPGDIKIEKIPLRRGEKIHEDLLTEEETHYAHDYKEFFVINYANGEGGGVPVYTSAKEQCLTKQEIKDLLKREGLLCQNLLDSCF